MNYYGIKSLKSSISDQYLQSRDKLASPWINEDTQRHHHHHHPPPPLFQHHHHRRRRRRHSFKDQLNISECHVPPKTNRSSFSSDSNDEMANCSSELCLSASPSPPTSASSTPKTNIKLKFGVDAILELTINKKHQEHECFNGTSPNHGSDSEYSPSSKKSFTNSTSTEISKNSELLKKCSSTEELENEKSPSCVSSPEPRGKTPQKSQSNVPTLQLIRPTFLYQMPYHHPQIPPFIPLLFASVDSRQKAGLPTDTRIQQYLTQQHAYHLMVRSRAFHDNSMNGPPANHQLYASALRPISSNLSQHPFTSSGYGMANYPGPISSNNNNNGCHNNLNNTSNLPSTTSNLKKKRSWSRAVFSNLQRKGLEKRFEIQKYVTKPDRRQLAAMLGLTDAQVKVWFQNRRMKWRHLEETTNHKKGESGHQDNQDENGNDVSAGEVKSETYEEFLEEDEHY